MTPDALYLVLGYWGLLCISWYVWLPVSFWFGRIFCRYCCPLGLSQSLVQKVVHPKAHVRRICTELPRTPVQRLVNWILVLAVVTLPVGMYLNPWGIFGRVVSGFLPGIVFFAAVLATAAIGKGRFWCNWICPFGTLFDFAARHGWHHDRPCASCRNCRRCFPKENRAEPATGHLTRRETLKGVALLAASEAVEKTTDGGFAAVSVPEAAERTRPVLPPGAAKDFAMKCVGCGICVRACPTGTLVQSATLRRFGQVELDFREDYCRTACDYRCAKACPTGALRPLAGVPRANVHLGHAAWRKDLCVRTTNGDPCTACVRKCPVQAIHLVEGFPVVDAEACIGCGACEHVCPVRPRPAIVVEGHAVQRIVRPIGSDDLIAEMTDLVQSGKASVVAARQGVIVGRETGRGIAPLMRLCEAGALRDALVVDKVIGRAAAAICIVGGAREVRTLLAANGAVALLRQHGVLCSAETTTDLILNRDKTGSCPMERTVHGLENPLEMYNQLRKALQK